MSMILRKTVTHAAATATTLIDPGSGFRIVVHRIVVSAAGASTFSIFHDTDADPNKCAYGEIQAGGGAIVFDWHNVPPGQRPGRESAAATILKITSTGANVAVLIEYTKEQV